MSNKGWQTISVTLHDMEIWGIYVKYHIGGGGGTLALAAVWLRRHSSTTQRKMKDCNMSRFWEVY